MQEPSMLSALTFSGWLFCAFAACAYVWTSWRRRIGDSGIPWTSLWDGIERRADEYRLRLILSLLFALMVSVLLVRGYAKSPHYVTETYYDVAILSRTGPHEWTLEREDGEFHFRACKDSWELADQSIGYGYVAEHVSYVQLPGCESIVGERLGFFYNRPWREITPGSGEHRKEWDE